jgi:hypothetical protein
MHKPRIIAFILAAVTALPAGGASAVAAAREHCIATTIRSVSTYFEGVPDSGWDVIFAGRIYDPYQGRLPARITDRSGTDYGRLRAGDRVRVCLVDSPAPERGVCDPRSDPRGRIYRVYDERLRVTYVAPNGEHGCGGA